MSQDSYSITSSVQFFRDAPVDEIRLERLNYHLKTGDYFPLLATLLGFAQETLADCKCSANSEFTPLEASAIENARKDLEYLHKNFRIVPNTGAD